VDKNLQRRVRWFAAICITATQLPSGAIGAPDREAQVTVVDHDVTLLDANDTTTAASVGDKVPDGTAIRTGADSRVELTFVDQTIARLGANSVLSFKDGARNLDLSEGVMLLQVPKRARCARIHTSGIAAAVGGTTAVFEYHAAIYKFLTLEGTARLYRPGHLGDSVLVRAGQMVIGNPNAALSDPVDFDVGRLLKTSRFITDFPPLRSERSLTYASERQQKAKSKKSLIDTNLVIFGGGTNVSLVKPTQPTVVANVATAPAPPLRSVVVPDSNDLGVIEIAVPNASPAAASADKSH
jgi:FecR-like protein